MWDNVPLLRSITSVLVTLSTVAVLYGAISYAVHQPGVFPLHLVQLSAAPQRVVAEDVLRVVRDEVSGNIFTVDIERLQQSLEKLPWVRSVGVRRAFPDRLVVTLGEHQALARWNGTALVPQSACRAEFAGGATRADAAPCMAGDSGQRHDAGIGARGDAATHGALCGGVPVYRGQRGRACGFALSERACRQANGRK